MSLPDFEKILKKKGMISLFFLPFSFGRNWHSIFVFLSFYGRKKCVFSVIFLRLFPVYFWVDTFSFPSSIFPHKRDDALFIISYYY